MKHFLKNFSLASLFLLIFGVAGVHSAFAAVTVNQSLLPTLNNGVFPVTVTQADVDACVAKGGDRFLYEKTNDGVTYQLLQSFIFPLSDSHFSYPLTGSAAAYNFICSNVGNNRVFLLVALSAFSVNSDLAVLHPLLFSSMLPIITEPSWPTLNSGAFDVTAEQSDVDACADAGGDRFSYFATQDGITRQLLQSFIFPLSTFHFSYPLTSPAAGWIFTCSNVGNDLLIPLAVVQTSVQQASLLFQFQALMLFHVYIAPISGTPEVGSVLTAGALTPAEATATYNWVISDTADGTYANTSPASTTSTYIPSASEVGKYLKVVATGTGNYSGISTSTATTVITAPVTVAEYIGTIRAFIESLNVKKGIKTAYLAELDAMQKLLNKKLEKPALAIVQAMEKETQIFVKLKQIEKADGNTLIIMLEQLKEMVTK
jgi:hypothetical protein